MLQYGHTVILFRSSHFLILNVDFHSQNRSIGFLIGLVLSNVLMGVVSSSVNTVIICFAENPLDFQTFHPDLCVELNTAWSRVWPGCLSGKTSASERDVLGASNRPWELTV